MDPFNQIPFPILVIIAKGVPDIASLYNLRAASPVCAALFEDDLIAAEITGVVVSASLAQSTQAIVGHVWQLLEHPVPALSALFNLFDQDSMSYIGHKLNSPPSAAASRRLLALARVTHDVAYRCSHTLLERFLALRPQRPVDHTFDCRRQGFWRNTSQRPFEPPPQPPSKPVKLDLAEAGAPIDWVEQQRALHGAWQLAFYAVVRDIAAVTWTSEDTKHLLDMGPVGMWIKIAQTPNFVGTTGTEFLETILDQGDSTTAPLRLSEMHQWAPLVKEKESSAADYHTKNPGWQPGPSGMGAYHRAWMFFKNARMMPYSPLRTVCSRPFSALGFFLWEEHRLIALGLLSSDDYIRSHFGGRGRLAEYSDIYTWKSVLTEEQLEALQDTQRSAWPIVI